MDERKTFSDKFRKIEENIPLANKKVCSNCKYHEKSEFTESSLRVCSIGDKNLCHPYIIGSCGRWVRAED